MRLKVKVPVKFSGTEGFPARRDRRYEYFEFKKLSSCECVGFSLSSYLQMYYIPLPKHSYLLRVVVALLN